MPLIRIVSMTGKYGRRPRENTVAVQEKQPIKCSLAKPVPIGRNQEHYDVLEDGVVVGRIFLMPIGPRGPPWTWASGHNRAIERAVHGYEPTRLRWRRSPKKLATGLARPSARICRGNCRD